MRKKLLYLIAIVVFAIIGLTGRSIFLVKAVNDGAGHEIVGDELRVGKNFIFTTRVSSTIQSTNPAGAYVDVAKFSAVDSAVNYLVFENSATGNAVSIFATGTDANGNIDLLPNGTGHLFVGSWLEVDGYITATEGINYNVSSTNKATFNSEAISDFYLINYTATGIGTTTLLTADCTDGRLFTFKDGGNAGTNNWVIETEGAETIDGAATYLLNTNYEVVDLMCLSGNWFAKN